MKRIRNLLFVLGFLFAAAVSSAGGADSIEIPEPSPAIVKIIEEVQTIFSLTINYIYDDGTPAGGTHSELLSAGDDFSVESPTIEGYTASEGTIEGTMPAHNLEFTVIYIGARPVFPPGSSDTQKNPVLVFTIEDYETSLGLGPSIMHLGIAVE